MVGYATLVVATVPTCVYTPCMCVSVLLQESPAVLHGGCGQAGHPCFH
jgi:hypothetical protein